MIKQTIIRRVTLLLLSVGVSGSNMAASRGVQITAESFNYSEPVSVKAAFNDLDGRFVSGDRAFTHSQIELGGWQGRWSLAWLARFDYDLRFHPDTAELVYADRHRLPVERSRTYQLELAAARMRAIGLRAGYRIVENPSFSATVHLSLLRTSRLEEGNLHGELAIASDGSVGGQAEVDYVYDQDKLLDRPVKAPTGDGLAIDLGLFWSLGSGLSAGSEIRDLWSRIRWERAPYTRATLNTSTARIDGEGLLETSPLLSGIEGYRTYYQTLPVRSRTWIDYRLSEHHTVGGELFQYRELLFPRVSWTRSLSGLDASLLWDFKAEAVGFRVRGKQFSAALLTDDIDLGPAHTLAVKLGWRLDW